MHIGQSLESLTMPVQQKCSLCGRMFIFFIPAVLLDLADAQLIGEAVSDFTGESVHGPGDVNNDGFDDILLGSGYNDAAGTDAGALYVVNGPVSGTVALGDADAIVRAEAAGDRSRVHGVGDVDADGFDDVMMGSMLNDGGGPDAGAAYLFLGSDF